jgi:hypothetical protein
MPSGRLLRVYRETPGFLRSPRPTATDNLEGLVGRELRERQDDHADGERDCTCEHE